MIGRLAPDESLSCTQIGWNGLQPFPSLHRWPRAFQHKSFTDLTR